MKAQKPDAVVPKVQSVNLQTGDIVKIQWLAGANPLNGTFASVISKTASAKSSWNALDNRGGYLVKLHSWQVDRMIAKFKRHWTTKIDLPAKNLKLVTIQDELNTYNEFIQTHNGLRPTEVFLNILRDDFSNGRHVSDIDCDRVHELFIANFGDGWLMKKERKRLSGIAQDKRVAADAEWRTRIQTEIEVCKQQRKVQKTIASKVISAPKVISQIKTVKSPAVAPPPVTTGHWTDPVFVQPSAPAGSECPRYY